jgi:hypothetical protein
MSERITNQWTPTLAEAFGDSPNIDLGRRGELTIFNLINSWFGYTATDHEADFKKQKAGIDLSIYKEGWARPFTIDVKTGASYQSNNGTIKIDMSPDGWLYNPEKTSDRIWHVNLDTGWYTWYDRKDMKKYIETLDNIQVNQYNQLELPLNVKEFFLRRGKLN